MKKNVSIILVVALIFVTLFSISIIGLLYSEKNTSSNIFANPESISRSVDVDRSYAMTIAPTTPSITSSYVSFIKSTRFELGQSEVGSEISWINTSRFE